MHRSCRFTRLTALREGTRPFWWTKYIPQTLKNAFVKNGDNGEKRGKTPAFRQNGTLMRPIMRRPEATRPGVWRSSAPWNGPPETATQACRICDANKIDGAWLIVGPCIPTASQSSSESSSHACSKSSLSKNAQHCRLYPTAPPHGRLPHAAANNPRSVVCGCACAC